MNKNNKKRMKAMEELRLPELQARFHGIVGEATRSPNKKFLLRRIAEALEAQESQAAAAALVGASEPAPTPAPSDDAATSTDGNEKKLSKLSVEELQALYVEVVGRQTGSRDSRYLVWKIREARKGRIKVGPVQRRLADGEAPDMKVLPLRMEADVVARLGVAGAGGLDQHVGLECRG